MLFENHQCGWYHTINDLVFVNVMLQYFILIDPYLTSQYTVQFVKGMQEGEDTRFSCEHITYYMSAHSQNLKISLQYFEDDNT